MQRVEREWSWSSSNWEKVQSRVSRSAAAAGLMKEKRERRRPLSEMSWWEAVLAEIVTAKLKKSFLSSKSS